MAGEHADVGVGPPALQRVQIFRKGLEVPARALEPGELLLRVDEMKVDCTRAVCLLRESRRLFLLPDVDGDRKTDVHREMRVARREQERAVLLDPEPLDGGLDQPHDPQVVGLPVSDGVRRHVGQHQVDRAGGQDARVGDGVCGGRARRLRCPERVVDRAEYDERSTAVLGARTLGELPPIVADLVPERFVAESLLEAFPAPPADEVGRVLLARAAEARDVLPDGATGWHEVEFTAV